MNTPRQIGKRLSGSAGLSGSLGTAGTLLRRQLWVWPILAALLLGAVGWWVHRSVEAAMRDELAGQLTTIVNADVEALRTWIKDQEATARSLAQTAAVRPAVRELVDVADRPGAPPGALLQSRALADVRALLGPSLDNFGYTDFLVVSPSMQVVAAKYDTLIKSPVEGYRLAFLQQVLTGRASVSQPFRATLLLPDAKGELKAGLPTMYVAAPVPDERGKPLAVLALRMRPEAAFTNILQTAQFGY